MRGAFIEAIDVDHGRLRLPMLPEDQLQPQQLLALTVIDKALQDSGVEFEKGAKVAVLVGLGTDMELYRHRARVALRERLGLLPQADPSPFTLILTLTLTLNPHPHPHPYPYPEPSPLPLPLPLPLTSSPSARSSRSWATTAGSWARWTRS